MITGGYTIRARKRWNSEIIHSPPHFREIWDWLIDSANHLDKKRNGTIIKRGQVFCSYDDIIDALHWYVGWRKMHYEKHHCENAMKFLRSRGMITTRKTTRGMIITILNYDEYQNPKNYESHTESHDESYSLPQSSHTINKNIKNVRINNKKTFSQNSNEFRLAELLYLKILERSPNHKKPDLQSWAIHIDYLMRIDKKSIENIESMIIWCQKDSFWQNNILSTAKLRDKFEQLFLKMKEQNKGDWTYEYKTAPR